MSNRLARITPFAKYFSLALLFPLLSLLNSCKDNTGTFGPNVLPKSDLIYALQTDTTTISTSMYLKDSVYSAATANILLGSYNDPIFGESKASLYAEVGYSSYTFQWPTLPPWVSPSCIVDSAVICLQLSGGNYGSNDPQTFVIYQNDTDVLSPHAYYSDTNIKYNPTPIGSQQVNLSNALATDTLRIRLNNRNWLNNFATQLATSGTNYWTSSFNKVLHGVYITTSTPVQLPGQGSLLNILPLAGSFSGIYLYYHYNYPIDTEHFVSFPIGGSSNAFFVHFDHNYSTTYLGGLHSTGKRDSINGGQLVYVQAMGGVLGRINFPNLYKNWSKLGPVIINEATITLPAQPENTSAIYGPPSSLYLSGTDSAWAPYQLPDQLQPYYGGTFSNNSYTFVITEYIQSVINGKTNDRGLYIIPLNEAISANGVVLYGAQHGISAATKPVLTIYYTPVKNH